MANSAVASAVTQPRPHPLAVHPLISVVIPCYNARAYVAAAIRSVLAQDWPDLEIVLVDDGSSDQSAELIRENFPGIRLVQQANAGVAAARNNGIAQARGEWIAFLDADDIWLPGKLRAQMALLGATPGARMSYTAWQVWASLDPAPSPDYFVELASRSGNQALWTGASGWIYPQLLLDCVVWTSTVLAHRSVFAEVGRFDNTLRIGEDWDLWLRASRITPILRVSVPYALYRMHPASITRSALEANFRSLVVGRAIGRWGYKSPDGSVANRSDVNLALAKGWSEFGGAHLTAANFSQAFRAGLAAIRADWTLFSGWKVLAKSILLPVWRKVLL